MKDHKKAEARNAAAQIKKEAISPLDIDRWWKVVLHYQRFLGRPTLTADVKCEAKSLKIEGNALCVSWFRKGGVCYELPKPG